jgi:hypothetical protein
MFHTYKHHQRWHALDGIFCFDFLFVSMIPLKVYLKLKGSIFLFFNGGITSYGYLLIFLTWRLGGEAKQLLCWLALNTVKLSS